MVSITGLSYGYSPRTKSRKTVTLCFPRAKVPIPFYTHYCFFGKILRTGGIFWYRPRKARHTDRDREKIQTEKKRSVRTPKKSSINRLSPVPLSLKGRDHSPTRPRDCSAEAAKWLRAVLSRDRVSSKLPRHKHCTWG